MAHIQDMRGRGEKKINVDLNLVPFIDLMSVCIIFLLITAVWTQVSMIQLGSSIYSKKTSDEDLILPPFSEVVLRVNVLPDSFQLVVGKKLSLIPKLPDGNYDKDGLVNMLKKVKAQYPDKLDGLVSIRDNVYYKHLIEAMDAFLIADFPQVSITTTGVK